jgi:hypothetical protein
LCYSGAQRLTKFFKSEQLMRDNELRGIILEALYNQRRRDLVDFETELGKLPLPDGAMESIVRQLEKKKTLSCWRMKFRTEGWIPDRASAR